MLTEFREQIMVNIATGDAATTTIAGTTTIATIVVEITIGGGEFRGLTNSSVNQSARKLSLVSNQETGTRLSHVHSILLALNISVL